MKARVQGLCLAWVAMLALMSLGCGGGSSTFSGSCGPWSYYADSSSAHISKGDLSMSTTYTTSQVKNNSTLRVNCSDGVSFPIKLSTSAHDEMFNNQNPCPAIEEILNRRNQVAPLPTPTPSPTDVTALPGDTVPNNGGVISPETPPPPAPPVDPGNDGTITGGACGFTTGSYVGLSQPLPQIKNATVNLTRRPGDDVTQPALYAFDDLTLEGCTVNLPVGQTAIYLSGNGSFKNVRFVASSATASAPTEAATAQPGAASATGDARNFLILGTQSCLQVTFTSCPDVVCTGVYAPRADILLQSSHIRGGVVGKTVTCVGSVVDYDPHLKVLNFEGLGLVTPRWSQEAGR